MISPFSGNFSTRMIRIASDGRERMLDAGCGTGLQACYLARRNPSSHVFGYDISEGSIEKAEKYKERHEIPNVHFYIASHDDYVVCEPVNFIYTNGSIISTDEYDDTLTFGPWESIVKRRLARFHGMLSHDGIYLDKITAKPEDVREFIDIASETGFTLRNNIKGEIVGYYVRENKEGEDVCYYDRRIPIHNRALIFERCGV